MNDGTFGCAGSSLPPQTFSSFGDWGPLFLTAQGLTYCGGFSNCGAQALGVWAPVVAAREL